MLAQLKARFFFENPTTSESSLWLTFLIAKKNVGFSAVHSSSQIFHGVIFYSISFYLKNCSFVCWCFCGSFCFFLLLKPAEIVLNQEGRVELSNGDIVLNYK